MTDKEAKEMLAYAAQRVADNLSSPNECDSNMEPANVVDGLFAIARAMTRIAKAIEKTTRKDGDVVAINGREVEP